MSLTEAWAGEPCSTRTRTTQPWSECLKKPCILYRCAFAPTASCPITGISALARARWRSARLDAAVHEYFWPRGPCRAPLTGRNWSISRKPMPSWPRCAVASTVEHLTATQIGSMRPSHNLGSNRRFARAATPDIARGTGPIERLRRPLLRGGNKTASVSETPTHAGGFVTASKNLRQHGEYT
jgi:hypothetical protein